MQLTYLINQELCFASEVGIILETRNSGIAKFDAISIVFSRNFSTLLFGSKKVDYFRLDSGIAG